jgi:DNA-binding IclR family transcriptional regulator
LPGRPIHAKIGRMSKIVGRTLDFLELFADQKRPLSVTEIARLLDIPTSSCHDVLHALRERGYLYELSSRSGYYPTLRLYEIGKSIAESDPVVLRAEGELKSLRDQVDESVLLAKVNGLSAYYLMAIEPSHPLRFLAKAGQAVRSLHATSAGKALLASLSESDFNNYVRTAGLPTLTTHTITTAAALRRDLDAGNRRGWFLNREESMDGVTTLSARFFWISTIYIVTIAGASSRLASKVDAAAERLMGTCKLLESSPQPQTV